MKSRQETMIHQLKSMENVMLEMQKAQQVMQQNISRIAVKQGVELNEDDYVGEVDDDED